MNEFRIMSVYINIVSDNEATTTKYSPTPITKMSRIQTPAEQQEEQWKSIIY